MDENTIKAVAALVGTIIGAGVLGIPYVFAKAGFLLGMGNLLIIGVLAVLMFLMLGETSLRTKKPHMIPRLAKRFLGEWGRKLSFIALAVEIWGAIVAYIIGIGAALAAIYVFPSIFGVEASLFFSTATFIIASALVYFGLRTITKTEVLLTGGTIIVILILCFIGLPQINLSNLVHINLKNMFLPYGVVLFAMMATPTVPELRKILSKNKRDIKKAILIGGAIPIVLYAVFAAAVVSITGLTTTDVATIGLGEAIGPAAVLLGNIFAVLAMASSFIVLALALKDSITDSTKLSHLAAFAITMSVPFLIYLGVFLTGIKHAFIKIIGLTGAAAGVLFGFIVALMWRAAKKEGERKPEFEINSKVAYWAILVLFSLGAIYTLLSLFGVL